MKKEFLKKLNLPDKPGVYFFMKGVKILYIGKATSLRERTKSYFSKDLIHTRGPLILDMAFKADLLKWEETDSVLEALILESNIIKKYQPYYNSKEKDGKTFNFVCITKDKIPKVMIVRGSNLKNSVFNKVYGPYTSGSQLREAVKIIRRIFPFLDNKSKNYMEFYRQINLVPDLEDQKMYLQNIRNIKLFFAGKKKQILINLKKQMKTYAKMREFEKAGEVKRQIFALKHINDIALLKNDPFGYPMPKHDFRIEAYDIAHMGGKNMVGVMTVLLDGEATKHEYKKFKIRTQQDTNDTGALREVLTRRLNHPEWTYPNLIVVDGGVAQLNAAKKVLKEFNLEIPLVSVLKDERHKPKDILGNEEFSSKWKKQVFLANSEAHRFGIAYHKSMRNKNFLK